MPSLPPPLRSGDPIQAIVPWTEKIIDYLRAITPRPSATVTIQTTANGTTFHAAPAASRRKGDGGESYVYDGEFAISRTASIKLGGEGESDKEAFFVKGGTVCVNGTRFTVERQQVAINSNSGFIYLVLKDVEECGEHNWEVEICDDYSDAIAWIELGQFSRVQAGETDEHGNPVTPGTYSVLQTYLGGSGANMVVIEDCYS